MKAKFTQGEWTFGKTNNFEYFDIDCDGNRICSIYCGIDTPTEMQQEAEANAKLIAAAPAMFKYIESVHLSLKKMGHLNTVEGKEVVSILNRITA